MSRQPPLAVLVQPGQGYEIVLEYHSTHLIGRVDPSDRLPDMGPTPTPASSCDPDADPSVYVSLDNTDPYAGGEYSGPGITSDAYDAVMPLHWGVPVGVNLVQIFYNPILENRDDQRLVDYAGWDFARSLPRQAVADLTASAGGRLSINQKIWELDR